jgi:hypothetical protein
MLVWADSQTPEIAPEHHVYVWWAPKSTTACDAPKFIEENVVVEDLALTYIHGFAPPLAELSSPLSFPTDVASDFTLQMVMDRVGVALCDEGQVDNYELKLCFGVNTDPVNDLPQDVVIGPAEPTGWATFLVDNVAPGQPSISSVDATDGRFDVKVSVATGGEDLARWDLYMRPMVVEESAADSATAAAPGITGEEVSDTTPAEDNASGEESVAEGTEESTSEDGAPEEVADCTSWSVEPIPFSASLTNPSQATLEVAVDNWVTYEICVVAVDEAGNESQGSESVVQTANDECDFMECYPSELKVGHCAAAPASLWWLLSIGLFVRTRARRWWV